MEKKEDIKDEIIERYGSKALEKIVNPRDRKYRLGNSGVYPIPRDRLNHVWEKIGREEPLEAVEEFEDYLQETVAAYMTEQALVLTRNTFDRFVNYLSSEPLVSNVNRYLSDMATEDKEELDLAREFTRNTAGLARNTALFEKYGGREELDLGDPSKALSIIGHYDNLEEANSVIEEANDLWKKGEEVVGQIEMFEKLED